jgi:hypothetical protein
VPFSLGDDSIQLADVLDAEFFKDDDNCGLWSELWTADEGDGMPKPWLVGRDIVAGG